jgi:hypothetical protein
VTLHPDGGAYAELSRPGPGRDRLDELAGAGLGRVAAAVYVEDRAVHELASSQAM